MSVFPALGEEGSRSSPGGRGSPCLVAREVVGTGSGNREGESILSGGSDGGNDMDEGDGGGSGGWAVVRTGGGNGGRGGRGDGGRSEGTSSEGL